LVSLPSSVLDALIAQGGTKAPAGELFSKNDLSLELLNITSDEQYQLNELWQQACVEADDNEVNNLHVTQNEPKPF